MSMSSETRQRQRGNVFPWMLVGAGALVYWTIALGIGIPSLADMLGAPRTIHVNRPAAFDTRCVTSASVDGRPVAFGDCFHVRFMQDSPDLARPPAHTVPRTQVQLPPVPPTLDLRLRDSRPDPQPDPMDSIGRTAY